MKKLFANLFTLVCCLFVLTLPGCSTSPDMMLQEYNGQLYEDVGGGVYLTDGKPNVNTELLPKPIYRVMEQSIIRIEVAKGFMEYKWTIQDLSTKEEFIISNSFFTNVNSAVLKLSKDRKYTITLLVRNRNNVLFTDTATLLVVENIYN